MALIMGVIFLFVETFVVFSLPFRQNMQAFSAILNFMKDLKYEI